MSECRWNFPYNGGGTARGVADAGIETFNGNLLESLARETCQNSLDAKANDKEKVIVEFKNHTIPVSYIPEYDKLVDIFDKLYNYWNKSSDKARVFLDRARKELKESQINVLRISDYNTTGLMKPFESELDSAWYQMTKVEGGGSKSNEKGGGFGIGKNAPYANSMLRTVFYRSITADNEIAAQGIARLLSYPDDPFDKNNTMTMGFGYYGDPNGNMPVNAIQKLDDIHKRTEVGTDLFIYGFDKSISRDWETDVIIEILNNFLLSIYYDKLEVRVGFTTLSKATLEDNMEQYIKNNKKASCKTCYSNYLVLTSDKTQQIIREFHGLGSLKLSVLVDPNLELDRKILRTRRSGMKLFARGNISRVITFSGILELEGEDLKEYFKNLEPPAHDKWEADRNKENIYEAKAYLEEINKWEQDTIWELGQICDTEEVDVTGLSDVLASNTGIGGTKEVTPKETLDYQLGEISIIEREIKTGAKGKFQGVKGSNPGGAKIKTKGKIDDAGGNEPGIRTLKGTKPRKKVKPHKAIEDPAGSDIAVVSENNKQQCPLEKLRVFKLSSNMYQATFVIPNSIGEGHIEIGSIGENNKVNKLSLLSAIGISNCNNVSLSNNNINFNGIIGETKVVVKFELSDSKNYAMEVDVYEH